MKVMIVSAQEVLRWIQDVVKEVGADVTTEQLKEFVWKTLKSGKVSNSKLLGELLPLNVSVRLLHLLLGISGLCEKII